ncbi:MAG: MFS transporter [Cyanobacteria bacterium SBLK]|nr:MFS transporter [Cyanobacteria bacterium SBLK]
MNNAKVLLILFLTVFIDLIGLGIIIPLLPFYAEHFGASPAIITLLFSCFSLMQFLFSPFWGAWSDRIGRKPIILVSMAGSCLAYLWCGLATSLWMLFASRLLAGFMGGTAVTAQAYISDITTAENRAKGMGLIGASFGLSFTLGPALGGFLAGVNTESINYQLPLLVASGLSLGGLIFACLALPQSKPDTSERSTRIVSASKRLLELIATLKRPLINRLISVFFLIGVGLLGAQTTLALWLERQFSWGPQQTGYLLMFCGIIATLFQGGLIGILNKKFGEVNLLASGLIILGMGLFLTPFSSNLVLLLGAMSFLTIGESLATTSTRSVISQLAEPHETGKLLGMTQSALSLGTIVGPSFAGFIFVTIGKDSPFFNGALLILIATIACFPGIPKMRSRLKSSHQ